MELTKNDKALINDLINIAWSSGAVKAPQMGQTIEDLRRKILTEDKKEE